MEEWCSEPLLSWRFCGALFCVKPRCCVQKKFQPWTGSPFSGNAAKAQCWTWLSFSALCFDSQLLSRVLNSRHRAVAAGGLIGMVMHCIGWSWKLLGAEIFDRTSSFGLQWRWGPATSEAESDEFHVGDVSSVRVISWLRPQCAYDNQNHGGNDVLNHYFLDVFFWCPILSQTQMLGSEKVSAMDLQSILRKCSQSTVLDMTFFFHSVLGQVVDGMGPNGMFCAFLRGHEWHI